MTPTTPERFCTLRDQRRSGEEAPEYTEKRAFEIAVLALVTAPPAAAQLVLNEQRQVRAEIVRRAVKIGDVITHTGCMGYLFEHEFLGWEGPWIHGRPTRDTYRFEDKDGGRGANHNVADDIAPGNVTHINRVPIDAVELLATAAPARREGEL